MSAKTVVLTNGQIQLKMERMALEIAARLGDEAGAVKVLGIQGNGWLLAQKMTVFLQALLPQVQAGQMMMDKRNPHSATLQDGLVLNGDVVILCDDVSNSGQTLLYALKPLLPLHLRQLITLVLVERMHHLYPVKPDFSGLRLATSPTDYITVEQSEDEFTTAMLETTA